MQWLELKYLLSILYIFVVISELILPGQPLMRKRRVASYDYA